MKQSKKFNKCIKRAIEAAKKERKNLIEYRDTWERAIQEKDRQIKTLSGMLTPRKLAFSIEVKEEKEKPFNEVWDAFVKTLHEDTLMSKGCLERGKRWCELFYNYHQINTDTITSSIGYSDVEHYIFVPFLDFIDETHILVDYEQHEVETGTSGYIHYKGKWLLNASSKSYIIQRIKPTT